MQLSALRHWFHKRSLRIKILGPLAISTLVFAALIIYTSYNGELDSIKTQAQKQAESIAAQTLAVRAIYTQDVVGKLTADKLPIKTDVNFANQVGAIPLPATFVHRVSDLINQQKLYTLDLISPWPINPTKGLSSAWEKEALAALIKDPQLNQSSLQQLDGSPALFYAKTDFASDQSCVTCHNNLPSSPKTDFKVGDLMGALIVRIPLGPQFAAASTKAFTTSIGTLITLALFVIFLALLQQRFVLEPVNHLAQASRKLAEGDRNIKLDVISQDEIGQLSNAFNNMAVQVSTHTDNLTKANMLLQEASRLKSEFLATMSHELRTPLNTVIGFSGIMIEGIDGELDDSAQFMVQGIYESSTHLLNLINQVLDLSKIEAGRMELALSNINVRELVARWQSHMDVLARQKDLSLTVQVDPAVPEILRGDKERITEIANNLVGNAIKFTEKGSVELSLTWERGVLMLRVVDTGIGIPPHALNYIFDEFRQVDGSSQRRYGGTGLGLSIVQRLVRIMGGDVQVVSKLKEGSTFTVRLPLQPVVSQAQPAAVQGV
jgi:signal transduction histidine kinase